MRFIPLENREQRIKNKDIEQGSVNPGALKEFHQYNSRAFALRSCVFSVLGSCLLVLVSLLFMIGWECEASDLTKVSELLEKGSVREAEEVLKTLRPGPSERGLYELLYGKVSIRLNRVNEALEHLRLASSYGNDNLKEEALYLRASLYASIKFYPEAVTAFKLLLNLFPESRYSREAVIGIAESLRKQNLYEEALRYYERAKALSHDPAVLYGKANTLHLMGRISEANRLYLELLLNDTGFIKTSPETRLLIGENMRLFKRYDEARRFFTSVKEVPYRYRAYLGMGMIEMETSNCGEAIRYFEQALQSEERSVRQKALLMGSECLVNLGRPKEARSMLMEMKTYYPYGPENEKSDILLAKIYMKEQNFSEAARHLKGLIFKRTPSSEARELLKTLILEAGQREYETFISLWRESAKLFLEPSNTQFLFQVTSMLKVPGKEFFEVVKWLYENTLKEEKRKASFLMAQFYLSIGDYERAHQILGGIKAEYEHENIILAEISLKRGDYPSAIRYLRQIKELKKEHIPLLLESSIFKKDPQIMSILGEVVDRYGDPSSYIGYADLLYEMGQKEKALKYYRLALSLSNQKALSENDLEWTAYRISLITGKVVKKDKTPDKRFDESRRTTGISGLLVLFDEESALIKRLRRNIYGP